MGDTPKQSVALKDYMAVARDAVFIVAVVLYFIGFMYFYSYNNRFDISVSLGDVPIYQLFVYSYIVFSGFWWILLILAVLVFVLLSVHVGFLQGGEAAKPEDAAGFVLLAFLIVLVAAVLLGYVAELKGEKDADDIRNAAVWGCAKFGQATFASPIVFLFTDAAIGRYPKRLLAANKSGRLQLIYETADTYYVALHECPSGHGKSSTPLANVFALQKHDVTLYGVELPT